MSLTSNEPFAGDRLDAARVGVFKILKLFVLIYFA